MSETAGSPPKGSGWVGSKTGAVVIAAAAVALAFVLIIAFMLSPSMSPLASVHDKDGDGYVGAVDDFPDDASEWNDLDGDGVGDNSDAFADDANETLDSDSDGVGDNSDDFPDDPDEWYDTDGDGWGDNVDVFPDDPDRASPMMSTSTSMFDGHLVCMVVDLYPEFPWSDLRITMSIDSETVAWEPDSDDLDGEDSRSTHEYETYDLGTIRVYLLVVDGEGDGMVSELDAFAIYPEDGSFDSGVEYTYAFEYEPTEYTFTEGSFQLDLTTPVTFLMDEPITDGVKVTFGAVDENVDWGQISLVISDGTSAGGWSNLTADMLDDGLGDTQVMQTVTIGSLVVSFTIVDLSGNGEVNQGDFIRLTATSFAADTDYTFTAIYEPTDGAMGQCTFSG